MGAETLEVGNAAPEEVPANHAKSPPSRPGATRMAREDEKQMSWTLPGPYDDMTSQAMDLDLEFMWRWRSTTTTFQAVARVGADRPAPRGRGGMCGVASDVFHI